MAAPLSLSAYVQAVRNLQRDRTPFNYVLAFHKPLDKKFSNLSSPRDSLSPRFSSHSQDRLKISHQPPKETLSFVFSNGVDDMSMHTNPKRVEYR